MNNEITIPILPCPSITEILTFYQALGFAVTHRQARPNTYAVVERGGIVLHFFAMSGIDPANSYSTCLVVVPDSDALYQAFAAGLRQHYGRLLTTGIPRMTKLRSQSGGTRGFNAIDPGGNWIRVTQTVEASDAELPGEAKNASTRLSRAVRAADLLAASKGDHAAAAQLLDAALAHDEPSPTTHKVQALVLRAEIALKLGERPLAETLLANLRALPLLTMSTPNSVTNSTVQRPVRTRCRQLAKWLTQVIGAAGHAPRCCCQRRPLGPAISAMDGKRK